jgi:hypothetical protein
VLALVPIPPDCLDASVAFWQPFVRSIAERAHNDPLEMERMLYVGEAQAFLVWDPDSQTARAFVGVQFVRSTKGRIGQIIWLMGEDRKAWVHLFGDLETYLREREGCVGIRAICRRGWVKILKETGYRETHVVFEKEFMP